MFNLRNNLSYEFNQFILNYNQKLYFIESPLYLWSNEIEKLLDVLIPNI